MRVHHLDCVSLCPPGGRWFDGRSKVLGRSRLVCHCVLVETDGGLLLVDTGLGLNDVRHPRRRLSPVFRVLLRPRLDEAATALRQIEHLGFRADDVRHIVLTHLDFDHAGGLDDFPAARVHLLARERDVAFAQTIWLDRQRYRPQQWESSGRWLIYPSETGEKWYGFECVRDLEGVPAEVLLVPLAGHTHGHAGVAIRADDGWLLHAGDAYFYRGEMDPIRRRCTVGLRAYQTLMQQDLGARLYNLRRLRALSREHPEVRVFCAHDVAELEAMQRQRPAMARPAALAPSPEAPVR